MSIKIKANDRELVVDVPDSDKEKWVTLVADSYIPDREGFVFESFRQSFPDVKVRDVTQIYNLCSRNVKLGEWLAGISLEYIDVINVPKYLEHSIDPKEYAELTDDLKVYNKTLSDEAKELKEASDDYKKQLSKIKSKFASSREKFLKDDRISILTLKINQLPLTLTLLIDNYNLEDKEASAPSTKAYAREMLISYQIALFELLKKEPKVDINKFIENAILK